LDAEEVLVEELAEEPEVLLAGIFGDE